MVLFFDVECNALPQRGIPEWAEGQPHIVQLCALLCEEDGSDRNLFSAVIKPEGWKISDENAKVHGITQEIAERTGIPIKTALSTFRWFAQAARVYVAHSAEFDTDRINAELHWAGVRDKWEIEKQRTYCTKLGMMPVCRLPFDQKKAWSKQEFKWPSLEEAHTHAFGSKFDGAHNAFHDTFACKRVFFWMTENGHVK